MNEPKQSLTIAIPKRWLQFRVRTLLLIMLLVVATLAVVAPWRNPPIVGVALDGHCPVSLVDTNRWTLGNPQFATTFEGLRYCFVGKRQRDQFLGNPSKYQLAASGIDVVLAKKAGRVVEGARQFGYRFDSKVFLFSSPSTMREFASTPDAYSEYATAWANEHY